MSDNTANGKIVGEAAVQYIKDKGLTGTDQSRHHRLRSSETRRIITALWRV